MKPAVSALALQDHLPLEGCFDPHHATLHLAVLAADALIVPPARWYVLSRFLAEEHGLPKAALYATRGEDGWLAVAPDLALALLLTDHLVCAC